MKENAERFKEAVSTIAKAAQVPVIKQGKVKAVSVEQMTCSVEPLDAAEGYLIEGVRLNMREGLATMGVMLLPAVGAQCIIMEVDGPGTYELLKADGYMQITVISGGDPKITVSADTLAIKGPGGRYVTLVDDKVKLSGEDAGVPKTPELIGVINDVIGQINELRSYLNSWVPVSGDGGAALKALVTTWASTPMPDKVNSDIENPNVLQ